MKTKKPIGRIMSNDNEPMQESPVPEQGDDITRLSFPVDKDGSVQWDSMRQATREKLKAILVNPETKKTLGIEDPKPVEHLDVFDPKWTGTLYDMIGKLEAFLGQKIYKLSPDVAATAFTYSQEEKEQLAEPTAKVINKYAPALFVRFKDEIALAGLFVMITTVKFQMAMALKESEEYASVIRLAKADGVPERSDA